MTCEDIENEHRAIDDRQRNQLFQILALAGANVVEHEEQVRAERTRTLGYFLCLSRSDEHRGINRVAPLHDAIENARSGRFGKRFELEQLRFERPPRIVRVDGDDERRYVASGVSRSTSQRSPSL
jgi:hypothetical protein